MLYPKRKFEAGVVAGGKRNSQNGTFILKQFIEEEKQNEIVNFVQPISVGEPF